MPHSANKSWQRRFLWATSHNKRLKLSLQSARPGPQIDAVSTKVQTNHSNPIFSLHSWHNMPTPVAAPESESRLKKLLQRNEAMVTTYRVICNELNFEYSIHIAHHYLIPSYTHDIQWLSRNHTDTHQGSSRYNHNPLFSKETSAASSKYIPSPLFNKVTSTNFEIIFSLSPYCCHPKGCWWSFMTFWSQWQKLHKAAQLIRLDVKPWLKNKGVEWVVWIRSSGVFQDVSEGPQIRRTECAKNRFNIQRFIPMHSLVTRGDFRPDKCSMVSVTFMNG